MSYLDKLWIVRWNGQKIRQVVKLGGPTLIIDLAVTIDVSFTNHLVDFCIG